MEFFKANTKIDFMKQRKIATAFSVLLFIFSITSFIFKGLNLGLDFTGGTQIELHAPNPIDLLKVREKLKKQGFHEATVQPYGSSQDILIRIGVQKKLNEQQLKTVILNMVSGGVIEQMQYIGPQVGKTLAMNGILAVLASLLAMMVYIGIRFEYRFAVSATLALIHDPLLILGVFSFFHLEFNLIVLAALLTVIGYSLNDTVVVYDRIRENFRKMRKASTIEVVNASINQTLSRTIMTSGLTLSVVLVLLVFGGETLSGFSLALAIGIVIGTYSSIYIAGSTSVAMGLKRNHLLPPAKTELDNAP